MDAVQYNLHVTYIPFCFRHACNVTHTIIYAQLTNKTFVNKEEPFYVTVCEGDYPYNEQRLLTLLGPQLLLSFSATAC